MAAPPASNVSESGENDPPQAKRACLAARRIGREVVCPYSGERYDSVLEYQTFALFQALGIRYTVSVPGFPVSYGGGKHTYTPDGLIYDVDDGGVLVLEIKPAFPHRNELTKCAEVASLMRRPVVLLHGDALRSGFAEGNAEMGYPHDKGHRGLWFEFDGQGVVTTLCGLCCDEDGTRARIRKYAFGAKDHFVHPEIDAARSHVASLPLQ